MKRSLKGLGFFVVLAAISWAGFIWHPVHARRTGLFQYAPDPGYVFQQAGLMPTARWKAGQADPDHAHLMSGRSDGRWWPETGYYWRGGSDGNERDTADVTDVVWQANMSAPTNPHIITSDQAGYWAPDDGYQWDAANDSGLRPLDALVSVHWARDIGHLTKPHIHSDTQEGYWTPDQGYGWLDQQNLVAAWDPGLPVNGHAHVIAASTEGSWVPKAGYQWADGSDGNPRPASQLSDAHWMSGLPYPNDDCIVSKTTEGSWTAIEGHHMQRDPDGRIRIVANSSDPNWSSAAAKIFGAVLMHAMSEPSTDDSTLSSAAKAAGELRAGELGLSGMQDIFDPTASDKCANVLLSSTWR